MKSLTICGAILLLTAPALAANWGQWRGPHFNGSTDERNLPTVFSQTENVAWSVDLPGTSAATPVVWNDHVFVSSTDLEKQVLKAMCFDRKSGKLLWQHDLGKGLNQDERSTFSAPSPATDGKRVVFFYGNGALITCDFQGKQLWERNLGPFAFQWTFSTSPVLYNDVLYMQVLQRDVPVNGKGRPDKNESYLLALNPDTGETLWRHLRPSNANAESLEAFTTPMPFEHEGRKELLVAGGDVLTGHDLATGKELWRWGTWNPERIGHWRLVPSPIGGDGVVLACAPKGSPIYAVKAGGQGTLSDAELTWVSDPRERVTSDVPTPAFYDGDFFVLEEGGRRPGHLARVEPKTGKVKWIVETPGHAKYEASPLAADGKIYLINFDGDVAVIDAGTGKLLHVAPMETDPKGLIRSSVIASQGQLFVRTDTKLFCIGK